MARSKLKLPFGSPSLRKKVKNNPKRRFNVTSVAKPQSNHGHIVLFKKKPTSKRRKRRQRGKGEGILNSIINALPFELHLPGHRFTGPGTKLEKRLDKYDRPLPSSKPLNRVDATSYRHDLCYRDNTSRQGRSRCDRRMLKQLSRIKKPSFREKLDRGVVAPIIWTKWKLGL